MSQNYILIGGGLLIALVIMHGLWLAWRTRQDPLPLELAGDIPEEGLDDDVLGPEFPNGGARVVRSNEPNVPTQRNLTFEGTAPVLMEVVDQDAPAIGSVDAGENGRESGNGSANPEDGWSESRKEPILAEVDDPIVPDHLSGNSHEEQHFPLRDAQHHNAPDAFADGEEILAINVLARGNGRFSGSDLWSAFQRNGLTFGDMNIFHRLNPVTRTPQYSVANAIEPGTFDLSDMESMKTPGACLFLRLPGPSEPAAVFDDMLRVARDIGHSLDGEIKDENLSVLTGQTEEHYRQRIAEFSRKRMSKRY